MTSEHFTGVLADIAEVAGDAVALAIAATKGGQEKVHIPLPRNLAPSHWLVETVGMVAAEKIAQRLGGGAVDIPLGPLAHGRRAREAMRRAIAQGKSANEIVRIAGVHVRTVWKHKAKRRDEAPRRQRDLFKDD